MMTMDKSSFYQMLKENDLMVVFTKKTDGTRRVLRCSSKVPADKQAMFLSEDKGIDGLVSVYDIDNKDWRSFYLDSIIEISPIPSRFGLLQE